MGQEHILVRVRNLKKYFPGKDRQICRAVDDISFEISSGETLGLVGESGGGKTTMGRTMVRLYQPTAGQVFFGADDVFAGRSMLPGLCREMQMIFQDPYSSLDPRMTVEDIIGEPLDIHRLAKGKKHKETIHRLLNRVGLNPAHAGRFPHEFSGGQRQRIGIARALAVEPKFIICDEPVSALDVSIRAQVVNLLTDLQQELGLSYLFIAHDLSLVKYICHRVAVMYLGKIVEIGDTAGLFSSPAHPYTRALLSCIPLPDPDREAERRRLILPGDVPGAINPPSGCRFRTRCPGAQRICGEQEPELREIGPGRKASCHFPG